MGNGISDISIVFKYSDLTSRMNEELKRVKCCGKTIIYRKYIEIAKNRENVKSINDNFKQK